MERTFVVLRAWRQCPVCGSYDVSNPYDYSFCNRCGANSGKK